MKEKYEVYKILQKRINEIKKSDRKSYYDIAQEIGISESRLYTLMNNCSVSDDVVNKISDFVKSYLTKDEKLEAYRMDNEELKAENERLKEEIKYLEEEKKEKIQLLEQIINILYPNANDDELFTITFNSEYIDKLKKLQQTLQEIKAIAEAPKPFIDFSEIKTATEVEYDYAAICIELELRLHKVLELITKAEEE